MSGKSETIYTHALQFIKVNLIDLKPTSFQSDFESALRNGVKNVYPNVIMKPCWFHYTQALRRYAYKIPNFKRYLNHNATAKRHFDKFFFLPLLKPADIVSAFEILKQKALSSDIFKPFLIYFQKQWITKVSLY